MKTKSKVEDIIIRPVKVEDAPHLNELRRMKGIQENIYGLTSERIYSAVNFIQNLTAYDHMFIAEMVQGNNTVMVGTGRLDVDKRPRLKHCGHIGIMVHTDHQGLGIGRKLMDTLLDLADNWLMLVRVELEVFSDNDKAIKLYKSLDFVEEGVRKYAAVRNGEYCDILLLARYNLNTMML